MDHPADPGCASTQDADESDVLCTPSWTCTSWGACTEGIQARACGDSNACEAKLGAREVAGIRSTPRPAEQRDCAAALGDLSAQQEGTVQLGAGQAASFSVGNASHQLIVLAVSETNVTITVQSEPLTLTLVIGETAQLDTDGDGLADLALTLQGIQAGKAALKLAAVEEVAVQAANVTANIPQQEERQPERRPTPISEFVTILAVIALIAAVLMLLGRHRGRRKPHPHDEFWHRMNH